jgi:YVTN family beta-propeller protein
MKPRSGPGEKLSYAARSLALPLIAFMLISLSAAPAASAGEPSLLSASSIFPPGVPGAAQTVQVGTNPVSVAVDPTTHTVYVNASDGAVSVINDASCSRLNLSGCTGAVVATIDADATGLTLSVDEAVHTLYVGQTDSVAMLDTQTCNATNTTGCDGPFASTPVGNFPGFAAIDQATNTVYVPSINDGTVTVINATTCNSTDQAGCADSQTARAGGGATQVGVDDGTHTAYIANYNEGTVSLINTQTCNGTTNSGCTRRFPTVPVGPGPAALVVDQPSNTVYVEAGPVSSDGLGSLAMINGATCSVTNAGGCAVAPVTTPEGSGPISMAENPATRTVYAVNEEDDDMSVINAATCNATDHAGCRAVPPALAVGGPTTVHVTPSSDDGAGGLAVDPTTNTIYAASQDENNVSILNGATCNGTVTRGCTIFAPTTTVGNGPLGVASDPATNTVYVVNGNDGTVSVINASVCNEFNRSGCNRTWPTFNVGNYAQDLRVNQATDTIYVVNTGDNTVSVVNGARCNAHDSSGCGQTPALVRVGSEPFALGINEKTNTIYVANNGENTVSVIDGATCDGTNMTGCGQHTATIHVGPGPNGVAVNPLTNTVYVANGESNTVSVIDGDTCNASATGGCAQSPQTVVVGNSPYPIDVDQRTDTVYVGNLGDSTMSVIDGSACNATAPCGPGTAPAVPIEQLPFGIAVDQHTNRIYVTSIVDGDVATIDGLSCDAATQTGCQPTPVPERVGGWGGAIALDPTAGTAYVSSNTDGTVSFFNLDG